MENRTTLDSQGHGRVTKTVHPGFLWVVTSLRAQQTGLTERLRDWRQTFYARQTRMDPKKDAPPRLRTVTGQDSRESMVFRLLRNLSELWSGTR